MANKLKARYEGLIDRMSAFDAGEGAKEAGRATYETFAEDLTNDVRDLRGSQVSRGRIEDGWGFQEEDRMVSDSYRQLMRAIAQQSLQAQGLNLSAMGTEGDLISGGLDRQQAEKNARRQRRSGLFGTLGTIAGTIIGGPGLGTYLGGQIGSAAGSYL